MCVRAYHVEPWFSTSLVLCVCCVVIVSSLVAILTINHWFFVLHSNCLCRSLCLTDCHVCLFLCVQSFGFTSVPPRQVLKFRSCKHVLTCNEFWYFSRSSVYCEGEGTRLTIALPLLQLKVGEGFGCRVNDTGHLLLRINGVDVGVACDGLPTDRLLWGWVNVDSRVDAVQSQYTSGGWGCVTSGGWGCVTLGGWGFVT